MKKTIPFLLLLTSLAAAQTPTRGLFRVAKLPESSNTPATTKITIQVTFASVPTSPTAVIADLKYNKLNVMVPTKDDGGAGDWTTVYPTIWGGKGPDGQTYPGYAYTDGTGRAVKWHWTFALNWNNGQITNATSTAKHLEMMRTGFAGFSNHSLTHAGYFDRYYDIKANEINIYNQLGGYRTRTITVPADFKGFVETGLSLGYALISSQGFGSGGLSSDGNNTAPNRNVIYGERVSVSQLMPPKLLTTRLNAGDKWTDADLAAFKGWFKTKLGAGTSPQTKYMLPWFSHGPTYATSADTNQYNNFKRAMNYVVATTGDDLWVADLQEWLEYYECRRDVQLTPTVKENTLTLTLDYANVASPVRWRDLSLLVSGGSISTVRVTGADAYTYNAKTGLINVYKKKTTGLSDPATDIPPPSLTAVAINRANRAEVLLTYDRPVKQSSLAGYTLHLGTATAPAVTPIALTGSGKNWVLTTPATFAVGQAAFLDYELDASAAKSGDAVDAATGQKVTTYVGYTISNL